MHIQMCIYIYIYIYIYAYTHMSIIYIYIHIHTHIWETLCGTVSNGTVRKCIRDNYCIFKLFHCYLWLSVLAHTLQCNNMVLPHRCSFFSEWGFYMP